MAEPPSAPLFALLPRPGEPRLPPEEILSRFVEYASGAGISLYAAQEEAILELLGGKHVVLATPTGSGKSLVATALHFKAIAENKRSFYTCPIKALVNEKFFSLCQAFGPENVGMATGDASINRSAPILCCTAEILSNLALRGAETEIDYVVMDEFHYYADKDRGMAWQIPLLLLDRTTFLMMSATLGDVSEVVDSLVQLTGRPVAQVRSAERPVPLDFEYRQTPLHETLEWLLAAGKSPVYLVNFTQRAAAEQAQNLMSANFCTKEEKERIRESLFGAKFDTPYGKDFQRFLKHGVGMHHAGLLPKYRLLVERLARAGHLKVISGTDTLGMGVNIPIRTVLFTQLCKFDGEKTALLTVRDFLQIAGRAGRKGFDVQGSVVVQAPEHVIENLKLGQKEAAGKKVVKKSPPPKGYVHWDRATFDRLLTRPPEPLESRFAVTQGMLLSLLQSTANEPGGGYGRLVKLVRRLHGTERGRHLQLKAAAGYFRTLRQAGLIEVKRGGPQQRPAVRVSPELQRDFSLMHTLSLYLLSTLGRLDAAAETYPLDVVTLVESILENPDVILYAQLHRLKEEELAKLKAKGVEYQERIEALDKLEWPKPNRDFIYATFNEFTAKHPWVGNENIRPKSIAREMFEAFATFPDYVRDYGLQRSEGVLLRYLSEVYKTLVQTVPETFRNDELEDLIVHLRLELKGVDSSLLDEWDRLKGSEGLSALPEESLSVAPKRLADDPKALASRIRARLHGLLQALAARRYEEALTLLCPGSVEWTAQSLEAEMGRYFGEHATVVLTPLARRPSQTLIKQEGPGRWRVQQRIVDPEGDGDWMLDCAVEPPSAGADEVPLLQLLRIGI